VLRTLAHLLAALTRATPKQAKEPSKENRKRGLHKRLILYLINLKT
jgi:hypothetical protein